MAFVLITSLMILLVTLVLVSSIRVHCHYERKGEDDHLTIAISWLRYLTYKISIPLVDLRAHLKRDSTLRVETEGEEKEISIPDTVRQALSGFIRFHRSMRYAFRRTRVKRLEWFSEFGLDDAAKTGVVAGLAWSLKGSVLTAVSRYAHLETVPRVSVRPNFQKPLFHTLLDCIFEIRIGYIMIAGLKAVRFR